MASSRPRICFSEQSGRAVQLSQDAERYFGLVDHPDSYQERLREMFEGVFQNLRLWALDPYDLVLTKLNRNLPKDREGQNTLHASS